MAFRTWGASRLPWTPSPTELAGRGHNVTHVTSSRGARDRGTEPQLHADQGAGAQPAGDPPAASPTRCSAPVLSPPCRRRSPSGRRPHARLHLPGNGRRRGGGAAHESANPICPHRACRPRPLQLLPPRSGREAAIRAVGLRVLRRADAVIAYNDRVAEQLDRALPIGGSRRTILNGVDTELFRPRTRRSDRGYAPSSAGTTDRGFSSSAARSPRRDSPMRCGAVAECGTYRRRASSSREPSGLPAARRAGHRPRAAVAGAPCARSTVPATR